jgi:probable HAF family extracellular repeat protein
VVGESDTGEGLNRTSTFIFHGVATVLPTHAFLWTEGAGMIDLGDLSGRPTIYGGSFSIANAINNSGVVVGYSTLRDGVNHAFRWTRDGGMIDLNTLLPGGSGWVLHEANDINDNGQIVGTGLHDGTERAFRLTPAPALMSKP